MWTTIAKILATFASDPEKLGKVLLIGIFAGIMLIVMFVAVPISVYTHVPLGKSEDEYKYYINGANQMNQETGMNLPWQYIMAVDAVVRDDDFSGSSQAAAYAYKHYFIEEIKDDEGNIVGYKVRPFSTALDMMKKDGVLTPDQVAKAKDKIKYFLQIDFANQKTGFEAGVDDHEEGGGSPIIDYDKNTPSMPGAGWNDWTNNAPGNQVPGSENINPKEAGGLVWPTLTSIRRISSPFGYRTHPIKHTRKLHKGTDIAAPMDSPVYAAKDGTVIDEHYQAAGGGNMLSISHGNGLVTRYMHLDGYVVPTGTKVKAGQLIAKSGNTGGSTGPHLHFQIEINGVPTDPMQYF